MSKRHLRALKWVGTVPAIACCSQCKQEFRVTVGELKNLSAAQQSLQRQFAEHLCGGENKSPDGLQASG